MVNKDFWTMTYGRRASPFRIQKSEFRNLKITFGGYGAGVHLFPFRTEKLSPASPMILHLFVEK